MFVHPNASIESLYCSSGTHGTSVQLYASVENLVIGETLTTRSEEALVGDGVLEGPGLLTVRHLHVATNAFGLR